ncbi:ABC transporter ATP-binding protein [bacterium]|nr:ABC transporter ATP-binding protein [bacterium]
MMNSIEIRNLKFSYGLTEILDIPALTIAEGEIVFLNGPSGSGKSTLLELIAGILKSQSGSVNVCGHNLSEMNPGQLDHFRAQNVGYIFQSFNLIPYLSVLENIQLPFLFQKNQLDEKELLHLVKSLGLIDYLGRAVSQLSVGQQQRVAVARALIKKPKLILADEPTSALDYNHRENFLKILFNLCRLHKTSVLFVSHDLTMSKLFDRTVSLTEVNRVKFESAELL